MSSTAYKRDPKNLRLTGVTGLDDVLCGGLPARRLYLVQGHPGTGKTTLALQFLLAGVAAGERCLYVTLSETEEELQEVARSHDWSLDGIKLYELDTADDLDRTDNTVFPASEVELNETIARVLKVAGDYQPTRVVFDSLSEMRLLARDPLRYRRQVLALKQFFATRQATVLFLDDNTTPDSELQLQSIAHGVISLETAATEFGAARRRLQVVKLRGVHFRDGYHDYKIEHEGLVVYPRLVTSEHRSASQADLLLSGNAELDGLWGGGLSRGTSTVFLGPAGVGKSSVCSQYVRSAADRGEKVALISFEETNPVLLARARGMGLDLEAHHQSGAVSLRQVNPAELSPGELVDVVRRVVEEDGVRLLVIDSLNGYLNSMPEERFLVVQLRELLTYLGQHGVNTFLVVAQHGLVGQMETPVDVTYLADNVLLMRYFEADGEVRQAISVVKKRTGRHERTLREFSTSEHGLRVGAPLNHFRGVLTGVPIFSGAQADLQGPRK